MLTDILLGNCIDVLKNLPEKTIDTIYTAPAPFTFYNTIKEHMIGAELRLVDYIQSLINMCKECKRVLKDTGNLFIQLGDKYIPPYNQLASIPAAFEYFMNVQEGWFLADRIFWHRTETSKRKYNEKGFLKNYEFIFHYPKDMNKFYFNTNSKYIKTSIFSYPLEDSYYTNEFDSGLPYELGKMIIDTTVPANGTILDPLSGTAKLGVIAKKMKRNFIGIDIDPKTVELSKIRLGLIV